LAERNHIISSCVIAAGHAGKDGQPLYADLNADPADFLDGLYGHLGLRYPKFFKMDRLCRLGLLASEILLSEPHAFQEFKPEEKGIVLSNSSASLDTDLRYFDTVETIPSPALFVYTLPNIMIGEIAIRHQFKGENAFFVFKDFDANFMEQYVGSLLEGSSLNICLCGWVEWLREEYRAVMMLVGTGQQEPARPFTQVLLNSIYHSENG
jgi:hypothetical protein